MSCDPWPLVWPCGTPPEGLTDEQQALAVAVAQDILWSLTGRRLGTCTTVEWYAAPGASQCAVPYAPLGLVQTTSDLASVIILDSQPVESITEVMENGVVLVSGVDYRLGRGGRLYRLGGVWPQSSNGDPTVRVTYVWGIRLVAAAVETDPLPPYAYSAGLAVGEIATEIGAGLCGGECHLPSRVLSLSRQGVTFEFQPAKDFVDVGLTGLPIADAFIRTVNPNRVQTRPRVFSPDMARRL